MVSGSGSAEIFPGLRRGELVALQFGDIEFGKDDENGNRFILVQHNYVRREHTTTKSKKSRRVDMSRQLRGVLLKMRDARLKAVLLEGKTDILRNWSSHPTTERFSTPTTFTIGTLSRCSVSLGSGRFGCTI